MTKPAGRKGRRATRPERERPIGPWARVVLFGLPWLVLIAIELVLRAAGVAAPVPYFLEERSGERVFLRTNPRIGERFFPRGLGAIIPTPNSQIFALEKPPGTRRVLCLGESTTAGFPFPVHGGFPALLEQILREREAGRGSEVRWDVVNCGLTGITSEVVADLMPEYLRARPDLLVVYLGHNEFYGAGGVAGRGPLTGVVDALRSLRLYRALEAMVGSSGGRESGDRRPGTLMERLAARAEIAPESGRRREAVARFERNLERILAAATEARLPVVLCELVSNERDLYPFGSVEEPPALSTVVDPTLWSSGRPEVGEARRVVDAIRGIFPEGTEEAAWSYVAGATYARVLESEGSGASSATDASTVDPAADLRRARNRDTVPFRAPDAMNEVIRRAGTSHPVRLVPLEAIFRDAAGIAASPGVESFVEHLHPNFAGNARIAAAVAAVVSGDGREPTVTAVDLARWWRGSDLTRIDLAFTDARLGQLYRRWPYTRDAAAAPPFPYRFPTVAGEARALLEAGGDSTSARAIARPDPGEAERVEALVQKRANLVEVHRALAREKTTAGDRTGARRDLRAALRLYPVDDRVWMELATLAISDGAVSEARWAAQSALYWNPGASAAREFLARIGSPSP